MVSSGERTRPRVLFRSRRRRKTLCWKISWRIVGRSARAPNPAREAHALPGTVLAELQLIRSSMACLAILRGPNVPTLFQSLTDFLLRQVLLFRPIFRHSFRLAVLRHKFRRFHVVRFPIEIKTLIVWSQKILGMPMAFQAPSHAVRLGVKHHRHMIHPSVTAKTPYPAIYVGRVIVKNVIRCAMQLHPTDRLARFPTLTHRFNFGLSFC